MYVSTRHVHVFTYDGLRGVRGTSRANTASYFSRLALPERISGIIANICPGSVLARGKKRRGRGSSLIVPKRVNISILSIIVFVPLITLLDGHWDIELTVQKSKLNKFLLQPVTTWPSQEQTIATEKPFLIQI